MRIKLLFTLLWLVFSQGCSLKARPAAPEIKSCIPQNILNCAEPRQDSFILTLVDAQTIEPFNLIHSCNIDRADLVILNQVGRQLAHYYTQGSSKISSYPILRLTADAEMKMQSLITSFLLSKYKPVQENGFDRSCKITFANLSNDSANFDLFINGTRLFRKRSLLDKETTSYIFNFESASLTEIVQVSD